MDLCKDWILWYSTRWSKRTWTDQSSSAALALTAVQLLMHADTYTQYATSIVKMSELWLTWCCGLHSQWGLKTGTRYLQEESLCVCKRIPVDNSASICVTKELGESIWCMHLWIELGKSIWEMYLPTYWDPMLGINRVLGTTIAAPTIVHNHTTHNINFDKQQCEQS